MQLIINSSQAEVCVDWADYALLRDNIQHFIESGIPSDRFEAIHAIEYAVDSGRTRVPAKRLRGELLTAVSKLRRLDLQDCAVSLRTRSLVTCGDGPPQVRGTVRSQLFGWPLPTQERTGRLVGYLRPFVDAILIVTEISLSDEQLEIRLEDDGSGWQQRLRRPRVMLDDSP